jgi:hypothetical protein
MSLALQSQTISPLDPHLTSLGWARLEFAGPVYQLGQGADSARLESIAVLGGGARYRLDAPSIAMPDTAHHLAANAALTGPAKFIDDASGGIACVADLSAAALAAASEFDIATSDSPTAAWAECLTALATGGLIPAGEISAPAQVIKSLEVAGYTASLDGSGVKVTLVLTGRFTEVAIEPDQPCGLKLSLALGNCSSSPAAAAAARRLAAEVNRRLLLVRINEPEAGVLTAEVRLTMSRVHEAWLLAAMESLAAAAGLALRPLAALQDPALAARLIGLN